MLEVLCVRVSIRANRVGGRSQGNYVLQQITNVGKTLSGVIKIFENKISQNLLRRSRLVIHRNFANRQLSRYLSLDAISPSLSHLAPEHTYWFFFLRPSQCELSFVMLFTFFQHFSSYIKHRFYRAYVVFASS